MRLRNGVAFSFASLSSSTTIALLLISSNLLSVIIGVEAKCLRCRDRYRDHGTKPLKFYFDPEEDRESFSQSRYIYKKRDRPDRTIEDYVRRSATDLKMYDTRTIDVIVIYAKCTTQYLHGQVLDKDCCNYFPFILSPSCPPGPPRPPRPPTTKAPLPSIPPATTPHTTTTTVKPPPPPPPPPSSTKPPSNSTTTSTTTTSIRPNKTGSPFTTPDPWEPKEHRTQEDSAPVDSAAADEATPSDETTLKPSRNRHRKRKGKRGRQNQEEKPKEAEDE